MTEKEVINLKNIEEQKKLKASYFRVFESEDGKKVLDDLRKFCGYDSSSVCEQYPNELQTFFSEGKRRVFLRILSQRNV